MKHIIIFPILIFISALIFFSCGTSTGSRYSTGDDSGKEEKKEPANTEVKEDFDFSNYSETFDVEDVTLKQKNEQKLDIWYGYTDDTTSVADTTVTGQTNGYRVHVLTTDNLDEANNTRSDLYFKTNLRNIYIVFDPPFYKVKIGDFTNISEANDLLFKLNQMGYNEARVVSETVNIFK